MHGHSAWIRITCAMDIFGNRRALKPMPKFEKMRRLEHDLMLLLKQRFWKEPLWSDGYFCGTIGNASPEAIRHSIANQG
jgi:REP element-mobilizing transposase RayT